MAFRFPVRVMAGLISIALFALQSSGQLLQRVMNPSKQFVQADEVRIYERRFQKLKDVLPPRGVVGYTADPERKAPPLGMQMGRRPLQEAIYAKSYSLTQYVLPPVILIDDIKHPLVVGNFTSGSTEPNIEALPSLILLRDFGDGVMLFSRKLQ